MRNYQIELDKRIAYIRGLLSASNAKGIAVANSGGKDSALVLILCKKACENTLAIMLPCQSSVNFGSDLADASALCDKFGIENRLVDITPVKTALLAALDGKTTLTPPAEINIAPRLRMTTVYAIAAAEGRLVAGTDNKSEMYTGYFTKWGDGAYDFNPIADLTVAEVYDFLRFLGAPMSIIEKAPSAGLFEGQTDEQEMGVSYAAIDRYLETGEGDPDKVAIIERMHRSTEHKRKMPSLYSENN